MIYAQVFLIALSLFFAPSHAAPIRIDKDIKLNVPLEEADHVLQFIHSHFSEKAFLDSLSNGVQTAELSKEYFTDAYYDTPKLNILKSHGEIRHRRRYSEEGKKIKEWIQMKLPNSEEFGLEEIKFRVNKFTESQIAQYGFENIFPLASLPHPKEWDRFETTLEQRFKLRSVELLPSITIHQERNRVYIKKNNIPMFTVTVDKIGSKKLWANIQLVEIEIEINEILFSNTTDTSTVKELEANQRMIREKLLLQFPHLTQEQSSKYQKTYRALQGRFPWLPFEWILGAGVT